MRLERAVRRARIAAAIAIGCALVVSAAAFVLAARTPAQLSIGQVTIARDRIVIRDPAGDQTVLAAGNLRVGNHRTEAVLFATPDRAELDLENDLGSGVQWSVATRVDAAHQIVRPRLVADP